MALFSENTFEQRAQHYHFVLKLQNFVASPTLKSILHTISSASEILTR